MPVTDSVKKSKAQLDYEAKREEIAKANAKKEEASNDRVEIQKGEGATLRIRECAKADLAQFKRWGYKEVKAEK